MKFGDWQTLQKGEQERLIQTWMENNKGGQYMKLAHSAAIALKDLLSTHREITGVHLGGGEIIYQDPKYPGIRESEIVLEVCTTLPGCPVLTFVPTQFGGFRVVLSHFGDKRAQYIATWTRLFYELMGWDEHKTLEWVKPMEDKLNGREDSIVYHDGPIKTALPTLLAEIKGKADNWQDVKNELRRVIWHSEKEGGETIDHPDRILDYDWDYVRRRYEEILARYRVKQRHHATKDPTGSVRDGFQVAFCALVRRLIHQVGVRFALQLLMLDSWPRHRAHRSWSKTALKPLMRSTSRVRSCWRDPFPDL